MASGVAVMRSWPIIAAAWLTVSVPCGTRDAPGPTGRSAAADAVVLGRPVESARPQPVAERDERGVARDREVVGEARRARLLALEVLERLAVDHERRRARHVAARIEPAAQQGGGGDDLERRARGIGAGQRAVERRV